MACFLCSSSISPEDTSESIALTRIFNYLKLNDLSSVTASCCESCSRVSNNLINFLGELEVIKLKISNGLEVFESLIKFKKRNHDNSIVGHQDILRKTKEQCLKYLKSERQPTVILKRVNTQDEQVQLFDPIEDSNTSTSSSSEYSELSQIGRFTCHHCSYLKIEPKFKTKEDLERHKLTTHVHQVFCKSRPKKMHFSDYRRCLDDLIENEVISTTTKVRDKKFSVCICKYCPVNTRKYFNQNTMFYHLMEYHRLKITRKLEKDLYDLMEEDEEQMSDESETPGRRNEPKRLRNNRSDQLIVSSSDDEGKTFVKRKPQKKRSSLKRLSEATGNNIGNGQRPLRANRSKQLTVSSSEDDEENSKEESSTEVRKITTRKRTSLKRKLRTTSTNNTTKSSDDEEEFTGRKKQNGKKRKATQLASYSSSSSDSSLSSPVTSISSNSTSSRSASKPKSTQDGDDPGSPSDKADSLFSVIPKTRSKTRRKLKF